MPKKKPKNKKVVPKKKSPGKSPGVGTKIAYTIVDKHIEGGKINILKTDKAWWNDRTKVTELLQGRRMGMKWPEVQYLCGISERQREYFFEVHPVLLGLFDQAPQFMTIIARRNLHKDLKSGDKPTTKFYLERKLPDEFKEKKEMDINAPILIDDLLGDRETPSNK